MATIYDVECYTNYFLAYFLEPDGTEKTFEIHDDECTFTNKELDDYIYSRVLVGFNNQRYDDLLLMLVLAKAVTIPNEPTLTSKVKFISDQIINDKVTPWEFRETVKVDNRTLDTIDLREVITGFGSLKLLGARIGTQKLQELPIEPSKILTDDEKDEIKKYCRNDLQVTKELFEEVSEQLDLRERLGEEYGLDLRSKSDAQIAEAVIREEYRKATGDRLFRPDFEDIKDEVFTYSPPEWIKFDLNFLQELLEEIKNIEFKVADSGSIKLPKKLTDKVIPVGNKNYAMGIGGLHSVDCAGYYESDKDYEIIDVDVTSYYPSIIINGGFYPSHMGHTFLDIYSSLVKKRVDAKKSGDKITADSLKICVNSGYGKFSSKYSNLYSPDLGMQITLTGQLTLLMLIEQVESEGIPAISANTDGVTFKVPTDKKDKFTDVIKQWEEDTEFNMEYAHYKKIYYRDVNNYVAYL